MTILNEVLIRFWESNPEKNVKTSTVTNDDAVLELRFKNSDNFKILKITPLEGKELMWEVVAFIQVTDSELQLIQSNVNIEIVSANKDHSFFVAVQASPSDTVEESQNYLSFNLPEKAIINFTKKDEMYHHFRVVARHAGIVPSAGDILIVE